VLVNGRVIRAIFFDLGDTLVAEEPIEGRHLWETILKKVPYFDEVLTELKRKGYRIGIITNTVTSREEHVRMALRKIDAEKYFDVILTSVDVGHEKPDERIFMTALRKLRVKPGEAVMVGNRISADIVGGNRMGMKTILFKWNKRYPEKATSPEEKPTRTIRSLRELPIVIQELS
jgi:putative hydrolase of the HAD superfamily